MGRQAIPLLPLESPHWIRCPERRCGNGVGGSFVERLCAMDLDIYKKFSVVNGEQFEVPGDRVVLIDSSEGVKSDVTVRFVGEPRFLWEALESKTIAEFESNEMKYLHKLGHICDSVLKATKVEQLIHNDSDEMAFFKPPPGSTTAEVEEIQARQGKVRNYGEDFFFFAVPAMLTFMIDPSAHYVTRKLDADNISKTFYQINSATSGITYNEEESHIYGDSQERDSYILQPLFRGGKLWAVNAGPESDGDSRLVHVLLYLRIESYAIRNEFYDMQSHQVLSLSSLWNEHQQHRLVEGVVIFDDLISAEFQQLLQAQINALAEKQERDHAVDYHPHSNQTVRDLVHPALYSYIQNVTPLIADVNDVEPCQFPSWELKAQEPGLDFWGRPYETSKYQWLPSYVSVSAEGKCTFDTYINNLTPRDDPVHSALYRSLEALLGHALPFMESVLGYIRAVRPLVRDEPKSIRLPDFYLSSNNPVTERQPLPMHIKPISLRGQKLQVIPKIVDYELTPQHDTYEGVWHVEGMSHEEIVLTCLYILDRDDMIEGGEIEFMRAILLDEAWHIFDKVPQERPDHFQNMVVEDGLLPLGTVATPGGRLIVFPNSHAHRVNTMKLVLSHHDTNKNDEKRVAFTAKRRIVVFFVVNPLKRIISTREVAPQQIHSGGTLPHDESLAHRLALMAERKYMKQDWNVRPIELCEH